MISSNMIPTTFWLSVLLFVAGCDAAKNAGNAIGRTLSSNAGAVIRIKAIPCKIICASAKTAIEVLVHELTNLGVDTKDLVGQVVQGDIGVGLPPSDCPVLAVVHKRTNEVRFWKLTDKVKLIRLRSQNAGDIELKVINEQPLRVELWIDAEFKEIDVTVEMKT